MAGTVVARVTTTTTPASNTEAIIISLTVLHCAAVGCKVKHGPFSRKV